MSQCQHACGILHARPLCPLPSKSSPASFPPLQLCSYWSASQQRQRACVREHGLGLQGLGLHLNQPIEVGLAHKPASKAQAETL